MLAVFNSARVVMLKNRTEKSEQNNCKKTPETSKKQYKTALESGIIESLKTP